MIAPRRRAPAVPGAIGRSQHAGIRPSAASALGLYRELQGKSDAMRGVLQQAVNTHREHSGSARIDPARFRSYLDSEPRYREAIAYLEQFRTLFAQIQSLKLKEEELINAKRLLITNVKPEGMSIAALVAVVETG